MKYIATSLPSSSTSYYKSQRCQRTGSIPTSPATLTSTAASTSPATSTSTATLASTATPTCPPTTTSTGMEGLADAVPGGNVSVKEAESTTPNDGHEYSPLQKSVDNGCGEYSKPSESYVMIIATAIMESEDQRMSLGSIYSWIEKKYPYFTKNDATQGRWRNSVRHNLSLNDCFIKVGRCEDGKGNYWSIHPHNLPDFKRGHFKQKQSRRRRGRRKETDTYLSLLAAGGQVYMESGMSLYSPYTEEERKAYRLDEALMKRSLRGIHILPYQNESHPAPPHSTTYTPWQYSTHLYNQSPADPAYCQPYSQTAQRGGIVYNSVGPNVNYHHYYHQAPVPPSPAAPVLTHLPPNVSHHAPSVTCNTSTSSTCQCCPVSPISQLYQPPLRYN